MLIKFHTVSVMICQVAVYILHQVIKVDFT